jgi:hypothetical protein
MFSKWELLELEKNVEENKDEILQDFYTSVVFQIMPKRVSSIMSA